ncbi:hypothetical protein POM88_033891 [Heracleum sosnowskyi]|uniref:Uncharacterized protein n=1 Tax=Heracleum sosnowskyi TaxID=360622 RepID=A0AAD8HK95_9APIA|nr:hypothetical protein POM88_033891 [Heracleum sosnowskyi]
MQTANWSETDDELAEESNHSGLITFDMKSKQLSYNSFPSMLRGKVKPLVFQLYDNLYVMDTVSGYRQGSFEYFYPKKQEWNLLRQPIYQHFVHGLSYRRDSNYPCLVLGSACFLSLPLDRDYLYVHHPNITYKAWLPILKRLPFSGSGVTTFYHQPNFREFYVLSFANRTIRAHLFDIYDQSVEAPKEVFSLPPSSESVEDEQMSGYFADFGDGIFSLTASDAVCVHVCTFQVFGLNMPFKFNSLSHYEYKLDALSFGADTISVVGCFAPVPNFQAIEQAEEVLEYRFSRIQEISVMTLNKDIPKPSVRDRSKQSIDTCHSVNIEQHPQQPEKKLTTSPPPSLHKKSVASFVSKASSLYYLL